MKKNVTANLKYMFSNWLKWDKKSVFYLCIRVPAMVALPLITAYIPKAMIDCIEQGATVSRLTAVVAMLSIVVALTTWLDPFLLELMNGSARNIRMRYAVQCFRRTLNADYMEIESLEGREDVKRASQFFIGYYSGSAYFVEIVTGIFVCLFGVVSSLALIYKINFIMILIILLTCVGEFLLLKYITKKTNDLKSDSRSFWVRFDYFYELSKNREASKDIKLYGFQDVFINYLVKLLMFNQELNFKFLRINVKVDSVRALLNLVRELVAYAYLVYLVVKGRLTVSDFIFYFGIITGFSNWILSLVNLYSQLENCCNDCKAYRDYVERNSDIKHNNEKAEFEEIESIEFKDVCFKYPSSDKNTIKNMSFKVNKGENIAIVGENGAGKTTAIKILCGLYYASEGSVLINGRDNKDFSNESYFDLFSAVFQDFSFMPLSVAENVCVESNYDKQKLYSAFESAGIMDKINSLENKESTLMIKDVYKDAVDFSGGEKQKLLLAKAIYKDAPILILDEPTAALDPIAENELYLKYNELTENKISFFISHRLSSTRFCDKIMFISDGRIIESGTHEELMALKGAYYRMYNIQSYYYREMEADAV